LVFWKVRVNLSIGLCWFIPGVAVGIPCATYLLTCLSASPKQVWSWHLAVWEPSCFLSVTWHGEALYWLGVQGVRVLILLGGFFLLSVAPVSQQNFWFMELTLSASALLSPSWILPSPNSDHNSSFTELPAPHHGLFNHCRWQVSLRPKSTIVFYFIYWALHLQVFCLALFYDLSLFWISHSDHEFFTNFAELSDCILLYLIKSPNFFEACVFSCI
jgi:hypothetical protein